MCWRRRPSPIERNQRWCKGRSAAAITVRSSSPSTSVRQLLDQRLERLRLLPHFGVGDRDIDQVQRQALAAGARIALGAVEGGLRRLQLGGVGVTLQAIEVALV